MAQAVLILLAGRLLLMRAAVAEAVVLRAAQVAQAAVEMVMVLRLAQTEPQIQAVAEAVHLIFRIIRAAAAL